MSRELIEIYYDTCNIIKDIIVMLPNLYNDTVYCNHINNMKYRRRNMYKALKLQKYKSDYYIKKWENEPIGI